LPNIKAGAAKAVITPPNGYTMGAWGLRQGRSTGVHRHLFARALVLDDGSRPFAIVSMDVAGISADVLKLIRNRVERLCGISPDRLLVSSTHNHTTPDFISGIPPELGVYAAMFAETVSGAVFEAANRLAPARVGHGLGRLDGWTVNRQYPEAPVDTSVGVLRVDAATGAPLARVVNFACHGVCDGGQYLTWSGDFPGAMSARLEEWLPGSVGIFLQGAAGDVHPFDWWFGNWKSKHLHTHADTESFGTALAAEALRVSESVSASRASALAAAETTIALPRRRVDWTVKQAEANHAALKKKLGSYSGETWPDGTTTATAAMKVPALYGSGANELRLAQGQSKPALPVTLRAFRIGGLRISAGPGELFNELGQQIKDGAGEGAAWVASYCDEYIGYISTRKPHEEIAGVPLDEITDQDLYRKYYGTTTSPYAPDAGETLGDASAALLREI
jgi:hypothetical protein